MSTRVAPFRTLDPQRRLSGSWLAVLAGSFIVVVDQLSKQWALNHLADGHVDHIIWTLQFNLSFNGGMAFGKGRGWGPVIGVFAMVVIVALVISIRRQDDRRSNVGVGLIVGGALGNIADRLFRGEALLRGEVIDFIDFQWFPIFNVADIAVNVGGAILIWTYFRNQTGSVHES